MIRQEEEGGEDEEEMLIQVIPSLSTFLISVLGRDINWLHSSSLPPPPAPPIPTPSSPSPPSLLLLPGPAQIL